MITKTSSATYENGIGLKGWFESGNSITAIFILSLFILFQFVKGKKNSIQYNNREYNDICRKIAIIDIILIGIFLIFFLGTRTGLFGYVLVVGILVIIETVFSVLKKNKLNKKMTICCVCGIVLVVFLVGIFGGATLRRREQLEVEKQEMYKKYEEITHITGDLTVIKKEIDSNKLEENIMRKEEQKSVIDLYNIANTLKIDNNNMRMQQLIYNICLVKNQANPLYLLFGNGYQLHFYELILEMEVIAILLNFGLIGFILFLGPFIVILFYALYFGIKNFKKIDTEYIELFIGSAMGFALSLLAGYVFFSLSTNVLIIVIDVILLNKIRNIKLEEY